MTISRILPPSPLPLSRGVYQLGKGVIKIIVEEVRESARGLQERLVAKLRGPIQLTSCLQVCLCPCYRARWYLVHFVVDAPATEKVTLACNGVGSTIRVSEPENHNRLTVGDMT